MFITSREVVKSLIIDISDKYEGGLTFRLDIIQSTSSTFDIDLYQREIYSLRPNGESENVITDKIIWTWANALLVDFEPCSSIDKCIEKVYASLEQNFTLENLK